MSGRSDWTYERYRLGELSESEARRLEAEPDFAARMTALDESDAEVFARYPAGDMAAAIRERAGAAASDAGSGAAHEKTGGRILRFPGSRGLIPLVAAAAVLAAFLITFPFGDPDRLEDGAEETLRIKGVDVPDTVSTPELVLYRDSSDGIEVLADGDSAREHDLLQVGFLGGGNWWGGILSVDGNGVVTRHWPPDGEEAVALGPGGEFLLPYSYELDDAPRFEAFFLIWSDSTFSVADAEELLAGYRGDGEPPAMESINPGGKTGLTVIQVSKTP